MPTSTLGRTRGSLGGTTQLPTPTDGKAGDWWILGSTNYTVVGKRCLVMKPKTAVASGRLQGWDEPLKVTADFWFSEERCGL